MSDREPLPLNYASGPSRRRNDGGLFFVSIVVWAALGELSAWGAWLAVRQYLYR